MTVELTVSRRQCRQILCGAFFVICCVPNLETSSDDIPMRMSTNRDALYDGREATEIRCDARSTVPRLSCHIPNLFIVAPQAVRDIHKRNRGIAESSDESLYDVVIVCTHINWHCHIYVRFEDPEPVHWPY
ncbi:uncharacterized protein LAESUDRAFT_727053, partial [Laetiporus sulphureus 93-53]